METIFLVIDLSEQQSEKEDPVNLPGADSSGTCSE